MTSSLGRLGLTGDTLLTRRLSVFEEPSFLALRELLTSCNAAFTNLESPVQDYLVRPHWQRTGMGGTYVTTEPSLLEELKWLGLSMVACGSSHAEDYGLEGVRDTLGYLDNAGIAHAGLGRHLAEAQAPAYLDTSAGRVALVACTLHFTPTAKAGAQRADAVGSPGVNGIRSTRQYSVPEDLLKTIREVGLRLGADAERARNDGSRGDVVEESQANSGYELFGQRFLPGGPDVSVRSIGNERDIQQTLRSVELARGMADLVIFSMHTHELGGRKLLTATGHAELSEPSELAREIARRAIDAGASVVAGHGPQVPLGVEIYKGRPIFHSLGCFIFELETIRVLPQEAYDRYGLPLDANPLDFVRARYGNDSRGHTARAEQWQQVMAVCDFDSNGVSRIALHAIDLGHKRRPSQRGRPELAGAALTQDILHTIGDRSSAFGTTLKIDNGVGYIECS